MNIEELREYCLSVNGASECFPFDETVLVFKVMDRMFAAIGIDAAEGDFAVILKCEPEKAIALREQYSGITPGYHFNKKYWNGVYLKSDVPYKLIEELIDHSVEEVIKKLPKTKQKEYYGNP